MGQKGEDPERRRQRRERRDALARSLYQAGHHTTFQHAHFMFVLEGVSRQFVWSFLHSHPFYNSEQVSQRYVAVAPDAVSRPALGTDAETVFDDTVARLHGAYLELVELLRPAVEVELLARFPGWRRHPKRLQREGGRKAQEVARAVLPLATHTSLYHTVSCLTLFRYHRLCQQAEVPAETMAVVEAMVGAVLEHDPDLAAVMREPLPVEETPEYRMMAEFLAAGPQVGAFRAEFDAVLGGRVSRLMDGGGGNVAAVAAAVRAVFGLPAVQLADEEAVRLALDPAANTLLGDDLNVTTVSKLGRCLQHAHYTFVKKLSHAADSQNQRHRMTPAARPLLTAVVDDQPDVVVPRLVRQVEGEALAVFARAVEQAWQGARDLVRMGTPPGEALVLLPNALAIRFVESADLLNLHHKHRMRLCYNAQEEIWQASLDEALQVAEREPAIGRWLLPPCAVRHRAGVKPFCPEGERFCGVPVWRLQPPQFDRTI